MWIVSKIICSGREVQYLLQNLEGQLQISQNLVLNIWIELWSQCVFRVKGLGGKSWIYFAFSPFRPFWRLHKTFFNIENQSYAKCLQRNQNHITNLESSMGLVNACMLFVKTALREVRLMYGFELELWEAECLAEFHVACSEFISTWELCKIESMKIHMDQYWEIHWRTVFLIP